MKLKENPLLTDLVKGQMKKTSSRARFLGSCDEVCSYIMDLQNYLEEPLKTDLIQIVKTLFNAMGVVALSDYNFGETDLKSLLDLIKKYEVKKESFHFVLPGITKLGAKCHIVRTTVRRSELNYATLYEAEGGNEYLFEYLNKLSTFFYELALTFDNQNDK